MAAAAQRTSRAAPGTLITILSLYSTLDGVIEEAVTLDQLSNGRLDLEGCSPLPAEPFHGVSGEEEAQGRFDEAFAIIAAGADVDPA